MFELLPQNELLQKSTLRFGGGYPKVFQRQIDSALFPFLFSLSLWRGSS